MNKTLRHRLLSALAMTLWCTTAGYAELGHDGPRPALPSADIIGMMPRSQVEVVPVKQGEDAMNCGPTAAAILLAGGPSRSTAAAVVELRDRLGGWSWEAFPLRRIAWPGRGAGMTLPTMMKAMLERFGTGRVEALVEHSFIPSEALAMSALHQALNANRPVVVMVESPVLWGTSHPGLHWIVVTGYAGGAFSYVDPSDGKEARIDADTLWWAWRLNPLWRRVLSMPAFTAFVMHDVAPKPALVASLQPQAESPPSSDSLDAAAPGP